MPAHIRRELLTAAQRAELLALPTDRLEIRERYSLTAADFDLINRQRTEANRLGFAIQLCLLRYPGRAWLPAEQLPSEMLRFIAGQIGAEPTALADYAQRDETRREHQQELLTAFGWKTIDRLTYRVVARWLVEIAWGVDQSVSLVRELLGELRRRRILMPSMAELERLVAACRHRARQRAYEVLTCQLNDAQREALDVLLQSQDQTRQTRLGWIRESVGVPTPAQILKRLDRLRALRRIGIPSDWAREVHQNRLLQMARQAAGFTDHVFALCHLLGFRFAPPIRDLADKRLYSIEKPGIYPTIEPLIGARLDTKLIFQHWEDLLRLATSIKQGTVTASTILRKLAAYPRQNRLATALRELGRLERTIFTLDFLRDIELRRRIQAGLNKGEARNALARAVFFNRLGELRDRTYENQQHRTNGLSLVVAAIVHSGTQSTWKKPSRSLSESVETFPKSC